MREKILKALQTKYEGVDAKTLGRIADKLAKTITDEADIQTAVDGVTVQALMESYGDARVTEAQRTAVENYEKKYGIKDGKKVESTPPSPTPPPPAGQEEPEYIKALKAQMAEMQKRLDESDKARVSVARKARLDDILKDAPQELRQIYSTSYDNMQFADDAAYDAWLESSKTSIESLGASLKAKGAVTTPPKAGGDHNDAGQGNPLVIARAEKAGLAKPSAIVGLATDK